ncbi:craniofacial development protein 1 isoform X1 [Oryzias latipes]|uniref:Craniofacial development protein 1 n=1 Tax=Oryzias latipes TaxID=8090 RepID=A0A3B3I302_ORYLA|nr:craniofacial development protein 1 isoform X1 [Oryzias latipes]
MSYSDYDSDGYQSHEDEDYVPSDDNLSEDDMNECEKEDPLHQEDSVPHPGRKKKRRKDVHMSRKRRKSEEDGKERADPPQGGDEDEATQKKKSDDLWASFLSDVGSRDKAPAEECPPRKQETPSSGLQPQASTAQTKTSQADKVVITKVFDFAGEEVRVSKEVSADSREAKTYLKTQKAEEEDAGNPDKPPVSESPLPGASTKRPSGMGGILSRLGGKKPKMSTLEKSKMDWDAFKSEEGITEELAIHNRGKEGFVERKNFLERVDHRQFELEKAVRLSNMKQ